MFDIQSKAAAMQHLYATVSVADVQQLHAVTEEELQRAVDIEHGRMRAARLGQALPAREPSAAATMPLTVNASARSMHGTDAERDAHRAQAFALCNHFGPPTFFITINLLDAGNVTFLQYTGLDMPAWHPDGGNASVLPPYGERRRAITADSAAAARAFERVVEAIIAVIFGFNIKTQRCRRDGLLGNQLAHMGMTESQARTTNHVHFLAWSHGFPMSVEDLRAALLADPAYLAAVEAYCDTVYREEVLVDASSFRCTSCAGSNLVAVDVNRLPKPTRPVPASQPAAVTVRCGDCGAPPCAEELIRTASLSILDTAADDGVPEAGAWAALYRRCTDSFLARAGPEPGAPECVRHAVTTLKILHTNHHDPRHRKTCFKTDKSCRFHFPKPRVLRTSLMQFDADGTTTAIRDLADGERITAVVISSRRGVGSSFVNGYCPLMVRAPSAVVAPRPLPRPPISACYPPCLTRLLPT